MKIDTRGKIILIESFEEKGTEGDSTQVGWINLLAPVVFGKYPILVVLPYD